MKTHVQQKYVVQFWNNSINPIQYQSIISFSPFLFEQRTSILRTLWNWRDALGNFSTNLHTYKLTNQYKSSGNKLSNKLILDMLIDVPWFS